MQLAFAAAGAWAGSALGLGFAVGSFAVSGAQVGWTLGSMAGGMLFPQGQDTQGPHITDSQMQSSTYGAPIPLVYGAVRLAGNVIWQSVLIEHSHEEDAGGKGGGPTYTTYTYTRHYAIGLCLGPIDGVARIWRNGKLIYDVTPGNTGATGLSGGIRIYWGDEAQIPDSLLEGYLGVGNTPAFRGTAYAIFEAHDVTDTGGRSPQFSFEIVTNSAISLPSSAAWGSWNWSAMQGNRLIYANYKDRLIYAISTPDIWNVNVWDMNSKQLIKKFPSGWQLAQPYETNNIQALGYCHLTDTIWLAQDNYSHDGTYIRVIHASSGIAVASIPEAQINGFALEYGCLFAYDENGSMLVLSATGVPWYKIDIYTYAVSQIAVVAWDGIAYHGGFDLPGEKYAYLHDWADTIVLVRKTDATVALIHEIDPSNYAFSTAVHDYTHHRLFVLYPNGANADIYWIDLTSEKPTVVWLATKPYGWSSISYCAATDIVWLGHSAISQAIGIDADTGDTVFNVASNIGTATPNTLYSHPDRACTLFACSVGVISDVHICAELTPQPVTLASIVSDLCLRSGLTAGDIDISQLTDLVHGYTIASPMSARAAIEPLQAAYYFDAVESDGVIKFVKRGGAIVATIPTDDLAAHEWGQSMPDDLPVTRQQEVELPREISVVYADTGMDYQPGTQYSRRLTGGSLQSMTLQLPICMDANKAAQVADVNLFTAWAARNSIQISLSRKWSHLEPTDVIKIVRNDATYKLRLVKKDEGAPGIIKFDAVTDSLIVDPQTDADGESIYTLLGSGVMADYISQTITTPTSTNLMLLDIPMLRDTDNDAGFYVAAVGSKTGWPGAQIFKSADAVTFLPIVSVTAPAKIGVMADSLGPFSGGNVFDEINYATVILAQGELFSATSIAVLSGANTAVIGNEIVQFKTATLVGAKTYRISGLLRGRRGTEWEMDSHVIGERFILASDMTWNRVRAPTAEIGLSRYYKGVTFGQPISSAAAVPFTQNAVGLECYSPVIWGCGANNVGDITIKWLHRGRMSGEWRDYTDVPLSESEEKYDVEIYTENFAALKRTYSDVSTDFCVYTAAHQNSDWGSLIGTIYARIYQKSSLVGRGTPAQTIIRTQSTTPFLLNFDAVYHHNYVTLSEGSRVASVNSVFTLSGFPALSDISTAKISGKWYAEIKCLSAGYNVWIGVAETGFSLAEGSIPGSNVSDASYKNNGTVWHNSVIVATISTFGAGDIIRLALDTDTGKIWFGKNGSWGGGANPASGAGNQAQISKSGGPLPLNPTVCATALSLTASVKMQGNCYYEIPEGFKIWK